ncbi:hypothetical protein PBY51_002274 [Eleginops maclovinus]|uniref:Ig-like domain-containing protein n=1 Tax=Eleginops maclovinus TaxID=56733 RepID=A0AAN7X5M6_ELEMC|nr:hypothetical protein PBY51_002274 [Eleginops maclovinus]
MKLSLLLALLSVSGGSGLRVPSVSGQDVTLPCTYDIKTYGPLAVCWIRGDIPNSGCSKQLTASDGRQVVFGGGASSRYQLLGRLLDGDVSLTVLKVSELDAGRYGCRVEIPGWFNDEKHHIDLTVERAPETTTPSHTETASEQTHTHTAADLMSSQILQTNSSFSAEAGGSSVFLLCVVLGMLAVLTLVAAVLVLALITRSSQVWFSRGSAGEKSADLQSFSGGSGLRVPSVSGQDVTLPCTYDIKTYGPLATDVRWCSGAGASSRYQLLGRLLDGDVSLTVLKVSELDAGRYGCRVEIPGWFNDEKHHIDLTVERAPETTTPSHTETASEQTHTHTAADLMSSQILQTNSSFSAEAGGSSVFLLCVVLGMLAVLTLVAAVLVLASRQRRLSNNSEPRVLGPVASELQLQSRSLALENIYQVDEDGGRGDGGEYEVLP